MSLPVADGELARTLTREHIGQGHIAGAVLLIVDQGMPAKAECLVSYNPYVRCMPACTHIS